VKLDVTDSIIKADILYKDHRIVVRRVGRGWRASIYAPGAHNALRESPASLEECRQEAIIAEAKWIVDARCTAGAG
jgi:hypothetical protein